MAEITFDKQIDEQSKAARFYQEALHHLARKDYGNTSFEMWAEDGLDIVEEFYIEEIKQQEHVHDTADRAPGLVLKTHL